MKHFPVALHLLSQPRHDDATVAAALAAWDRAEEAYEAELQRDWDRFPEAVRHYLDNVRLHDGALIADGPPDEDQYRLVVRTDSPAGEYVEFSYDLAEPPEVLDAGFPDDQKSDTPYWMYDEFAADPATPLPARPRFTHTILLSDGRELRVRFYDLEVRRFAPLLTAAATPA